MGKYSMAKYRKSKFRELRRSARGGNVNKKERRGPTISLIENTVPIPQKMIKISELILMVR
jgi:hypothetical protein